MKKFLITLLALILCVPTLALVGCKKDDHAINMKRYFTSVSYRLFPRNEKFEDKKLDVFLDNKSDNLNRYTSITFKGDKEWLYKMKVEKLTFSVYSNETKDVEFTVSITNLKKGDPTATTPTTTLTRIVPVRLIENTKIPVAVLDINDYFVSLTASSDITISITDSNARAYFQSTDPTTNQTVTNEFKYDILDFQLYGYHTKDL